MIELAIPADPVAFAAAVVGFLLKLPILVPEGRFRDDNPG